MALVVITGGVRSGKSRAAQQLAEKRALDGRPVVVAVFASESDAEMTARIETHRASRPEGFTVVEADASVGWLESVPASSLVLLDCLGTCLGQAMLGAWQETAASDAEMADAAELPPGFDAAFSAKVDELIAALAARVGDTIVVTNETGLGVVPAYATGRIFRDELGRANRALVDVADAAYLVVAGRLFALSNLPREAVWPVD